jgi:Tol biopolymer transport system component
MAVRFVRVVVGALALTLVAGALALVGASSPASAAVGPCAREHITVPGEHEGVRELHLSRDGRWLLYERVGASNDLVLHDRNGTQDDVVIEDVVPQTGDLSADGSTVVYVQDVEGADQMFVYDVAEDDSDQVTSFGGGTVLDRGLETTADGQLTVTVSPSGLLGPSTTEQVFSITAGGTVFQISATDDDDYAHNAVISDDGETIAWSTNTTDGGIPQIVASRPGEGISEVTDFPGGNVLSNVDLSISGDGTTLAFFTEGSGLPSTNPEGNPEVYVIPVSGGGTGTPVTATADASSGGPTLDFLGELVAFHQEPDEGNRGVLVGDGRDETTARATPTSGWADWPAIAGDGAWIAFAADAQLSADGDITDPWVATCGLYSDVGPGNQFLADIAWLRSHEITTGYDDGTFRPASSVSRMAMSAFLYRLAGSPEHDAPDTSPFSDVATDHPFFAEITWLVEEEVASGYEDETFRPSAPVTRQAMSAFLYRFAGAQAEVPMANPFADVSVTHPFAREIAWMADSDISTGYAGNLYKPAANVSRQAMAAFLVRVSP